MEQEERKTTAAAGAEMPPEAESWVQLHESELTELMQKQAKAAITELKRQEKQERKKEKYHNTFTLMKCYRDAVFHIENAISDGQQLELKGMTDEQQRTYLESIRRTRFKTLIMTAHIDKAVEEIERRREAAGRGVEYKACVIEKDSTKSMIYGYRAESVIVDCYNEGDVSTGMRIRFTALGTVSNPILLNVDTEEFIQINATMKTGDVIEINTKYGSKGAKLIRDGVETDYFRYIDVDSTFMQLAIGDNMFRYDAASGVNSLEVSIFYSKEFLGV